MKRNWLLRILVLLALVTSPLILGACGDDDDDDNNDSENITPIDDDQSPADDDDDDTTPGDDDDDDDNDDNNDDDNDNNDTDVQYDSLYCSLPDPEGIGEGLSIGGGPLGNKLTVYVYSDKDCSAIAGALVIVDEIQVATDENGKAVIEWTDNKSEKLVTAYQTGYQAWSYQADAAVIYFRLRPEDYGVTYNYSNQGEFYFDDQPIELTNPTIDGIGQLIGLLNQPIYLGLALPNINRKNMFSLDLYSVITDLTYRIDIDTPVGGYYMLLWHNVYAPALAINDVLGITLAMQDHAFYQFPKNPDATLFPYGAFLLDADLGAVLNLQALTELIQEWLESGDITDAVLALVPSLIANGLTIINAGLDPEFDGVDTPDIATADLLAKDGFTAAIDAPAADADYLGLFLAEIPNRILTPLTITMADDNGEMSINSADFLNSDYILAAAKTNLFDTSFENSDISIQFQYGQETSRWNGGAEFAEADFLPYFDSATTSYNPVSRTVSWQLAGDKAAADAYFVIIMPMNEGQPTVVAAVPGNENSYTFPSQLGISTSYNDTVFVFAIDLPDEVDTDSWDPFSVLSYDSAAVSMWINRPLIEVLEEWFDPDPEL